METQSLLGVAFLEVRQKLQAVAYLEEQPQSLRKVDLYLVLSLRLNQIIFSCNLTLKAHFLEVLELMVKSLQDLCLVSLTTSSEIQGTKTFLPRVRIKQAIMATEVEMTLMEQAKEVIAHQHSSKIKICQTCNLEMMLKFKRAHLKNSLKKTFQNSNSQFQLKRKRVLETENSQFRRENLAVKKRQN